MQQLFGVPRIMDAIRAHYSSLPSPDSLAPAAGACCACCAACRVRRARAIRAGEGQNTYLCGACCQCSGGSWTLNRSKRRSCESGRWSGGRGRRIPRGAAAAAGGTPGGGGGAGAGSGGAPAARRRQRGAPAVRGPAALPLGRRAGDLAARERRCCKERQARNDRGVLVAAHDLPAAVQVDLQSHRIHRRERSVRDWGSSSRVK